MSSVTLYQTTSPDRRGHHAGGHPTRNLTAPSRGRPRTWAALDLPGAYDSLVQERDAMAARLGGSGNGPAISGGYDTQPDAATGPDSPLSYHADHLSSHPDYPTKGITGQLEMNPTWTDKVKRVDRIQVSTTQVRHAHAPKIGSPLGKTVTIRYPSGSSTNSGESGFCGQERDVSPTPDRRQMYTVLRPNQMTITPGECISTMSAHSESQMKERSPPVAVVISNLPSSTLKLDIIRMLADIDFAPHGDVVLGDTIGGVRSATVSLVDDMAAYEVVESLHGYMVNNRHLDVRLEKMPLDIPICDKLPVYANNNCSSVQLTRPVVVEQLSTSSTLRLRENIVYVSNIPYSMKRDDLLHIFSSIPAISATLILTRGGLSTGRGSVSFATGSEAKESVLQFHGMLVRGRPLCLQQARAVTPSPQPCPPHSDSLPLLANAISPMSRRRDYGKAMDQSLMPRPLPPPPTAARQRLDPNAPVWVKLNGVLQPLPFVPPSNGPIRMPIPSVLDSQTSMPRQLNTQLFIPSGIPPRAVSRGLDPSQPAFKPSGACHSPSSRNESSAPEPKESSASPTDTSSSDSAPSTPPPYMYRMTAHGPVLCVNAGALPPPQPETDVEMTVDEDEPIRPGVFFKSTAHGRVLCVEEPIFDEACIADVSIGSEDDSVVIVIDSDVDWDSLPPPQAMPASDTFGFCATSEIITSSATPCERTATIPTLASSQLQVYEPPSLRYKGQIYHRAVSSPAATPSRPPPSLVTRKAPITPILVTQAHFGSATPALERTQLQFHQAVQHSTARVYPSTPMTITPIPPSSAEAKQSKKPFADISPVSALGDARILRQRCVSSPGNSTLQNKGMLPAFEIAHSPSRMGEAPLGPSRSGNSTVDLFSESFKISSSPVFGDRAVKGLSRTKRDVSHGASRFSENVSPI